MADPDDREGRDSKEPGLSSLAEGYRKAAPYLAASTGLVAAVAIFTGLGHWVDRKLEMQTPWFTLLGAALGMTGGFVSFFKTVLGTKDK
jgi:ATP synthase protein I